ncbi:MAG: hypothetical protein H7Y12_09405 [Sphingobacteriaceae bacterium]|nr:hypothetical protein [Cytophagaceae bacterium]
MAIIDSNEDQNQIKQGPLGKDLNKYHAEESLAGTEQPLEQKAPEKGYSTDPAQGKTDVSLHLADEDQDRTIDLEKEAKELQESFQIHEEQSAKSAE